MARLAPWCSAALWILAAALASPASADRAAGRLAPEWEGREAWNAPAVPLPLRALRGRLVVLEFFRVDCPRCQAAVPTLNAIQRDRFAQGVRVVGACRQGADRIARFVQDYRVAFPVVRVSSEVVEDYDIPGYPEVFVIAPDGRILWFGDPSSLGQGTLDRLRAEAEPWAALADTVRGGAAVLRRDNATGARKVLAPCATEAGICSPTEAAAADAMLAWIDGWARTLDGVAAAELARGEPYEAWKALDLLARAYAGSPEEAPAVVAMTRILGDEAARREVEAGRAVDDARRSLDAGEAASAVAALDRVVAQYPGTKAAARAAAVAARHRKPGG